MTMQRISGLSVLIGAALISISCTQSHVFMADHGTYEIKKRAVDGRHGNMIELVHFKGYAPAFYMFVDDDPERLFWYDVTPNGKWGMFWSDLDGANVDSRPVPEMYRPAIDRFNNTLVYEIEVDSNGDNIPDEYRLVASDYDKIGDGSPAVLHTSKFSHTTIDVNPDNCGKIFWIENRQAARHLVQYDYVSQTATDLINSIDHKFLEVKFWKFAIDPTSDQMYWAQNLNGWADDYVGRVNFKDGTGLERWIYNKTVTEILASYPADLDIDFKSRRVYWTDINLNWIASAKMAGDSIEDRDLRVVARYPDDALKNGPNFHPTSIAVIALGGCGKDLAGQPMKGQKLLPEPRGDYVPPRPVRGFPWE